MAPRISLALALHNHQPVGNFGSVIAQNHELAYRPMLEALERHPGVRLSLHYTGPLLQWLSAERPGFLDRLAELAARGQVELLGGGYYEPVLAALPEADRIGQLARMGDELEGRFGRRPRGAWLAERVWEPDLPTALVAAGYAWTILDDAHFRAAAVPEEALWGAYSTDDQGQRLTVFGTEQGLRHRIPFGDPGEVIAHLRRHASEDGRRLGVMGDDGEKFGAWPTTWEHCWGSTRWVDRFFEALEANADWLTTVTPSAWLEREPPIGRVYLPTGSYAEMGEWALPAEEGRLFSEVLHADLAEGRPEPRWMRGGFWRNFQVKYREVNDLHKQMLRTSARVAAMSPGADRERALDHLYQGQGNDCYWHGLFGGIYLSHLRLATLGHLIAAEDAADLAASEAGRSPDATSLRDVDLDGVDEVFHASAGQVVTLKPSEGGGIGNWDLRAARHALAAALRRRPEAYHARLVAFETAGGTGSANGGTARGAGSGGGAASIHDLVQVREQGLSGRLAYDGYERRSGLVHLLPAGTTREAYAAAAFTELGDFVDGPFTLEALTRDEVTLVRDGHLAAPAGLQPLHVRKTARFGGGRRDPALALEVTLVNPGPATLEAVLAVEWSLTLLGGGGNPAAYYRLGDALHPHDSSGSSACVARLEAGNRDLGVAVTTQVAPAAEAWWFSVDTVSLSEAGFERTHQGSSLTFLWPFRLKPGERAGYRMAHVIATARDRAAEERA